MNEIVQFTSQLVQLFFLDGEEATNAILENLDDDPSFDKVEQVVGSLGEIKNSARWAIGEILLFIRYRGNHSTVKVFEWDGKSEWPAELFKFIQKRYGHRLDEEKPEIVEFLAWDSHRYTKFWLLVRPGEIRVWENVGRDLGEDAFDSYMRQLAARLYQVLDENTLQSYYYTVACFPRSTRIAHVSWTVHYETTNLAGSEIPDELRGVQRLEAKAPIAQRMLTDLESRGKAKVSHVRAEQRRNHQRRRGYMWELPPIPYLMVVDTETGEKHVALEFSHKGVARAILYYAGLLRELPDRKELHWVGNQLQLATGDVVATCPDPNEPIVANALTTLANRMKWKVKK